MIEEPTALSLAVTALVSSVAVGIKGWTGQKARVNQLSKIEAILESIKNNQGTTKSTNVNNKELLESNIEHLSTSVIHLSTRVDSLVEKVANLSENVAVIIALQSKANE